MAKLVDIILNIFDPLSKEEMKLQRNWERRLLIIQNKMKYASKGK